MPWAHLVTARSPGFIFVYQSLFGESLFLPQPRPLQTPSTKSPFLLLGQQYMSSGCSLRTEQRGAITQEPLGRKGGLSRRLVFCD